MYSYVYKNSYEYENLLKLANHSHCLQASITLLLMAAMHLLFYVPLACVRVLALIASSIGVEPETALALTAASYVCYTLTAPVNLANFIVRCTRVNGFARTVISVALHGPVAAVCRIGARCKAVRFKLKLFCRR